MGFLSPWFFAGLAALALPLWLHLLRQFKRTPQPFSSIMFFERRVQSSTRHRRLRYLALLAARLALLALLALAFANPFVNRRAAVLKRKSLSVIAIDRSFSMRYGNRMQQAKTLAHLSIAALPAGSRAEVVAVDSHVEPQTALETDKSMLNAAVDGISAGDDASSYGEFSRTLRVTEQTSGMHIDAHFFTDAQQSSMPAAFADLQVGPDTTLNVQSVGHGGSPNWAVVSVNAPPHVYDPAQTRVSATIAGWNTRPAQRKVSLVLDGKTVATKEVSIPDCGSTSVEFTSLDIPYGVHRAEVRIEPHDDLPQDDSFGFSMERSDPRRVLFLYARGRVNQAFYYKAALESSNTSGLIVEARPIEGALQEDLSRYVFVVLNDPGAVDGALDSHICGYISKGGAAFIAAGAETTRSGIIPMAHNEVAATDRAVQGAGWADNGDPALTNGGHFENVQFFRAPRIQLKAKARLIARLADGSPLLLEQPDGEGRILIFASTLDNSATDFPVHASFVPFVLQTAAYLAGTEDAPGTVLVGTPIDLRRTRAQTTAADVIGPGGRHELSLGDATRALTYTTTRTGFYEVQRADGHRMLVAANSDRRESDLTPISSETLDLWSRSVASRHTDFGTVAGTEDMERKPLWRIVLIIALLAAAIESVIANRYLQEGKRTG